MSISVPATRQRSSMASSERLHANQEASHTQQCMRHAQAPLAQAHWHGEGAALKTEVTTCAMHSMLLYCHPGDVLRERRGAPAEPAERLRLHGGGARARAHHHRLRQLGHARHVQACVQPCQSCTSALRPSQEHRSALYESVV